VKFTLLILLALGSTALASPWRKGNPKLDALTAYLFPAQGNGKTGVRTDGLVVWHKGQIELEQYANGYTAEMRHLAFSVSKSFSNAVVGAAVLAGKLRVEDSICKYFPERQGTAYCDVTIDHLLRHSSGLGWSETYEKDGSPTQSSVLAMLYGKGHLDMAGFALGHPIAYPAGTWWSYSSGGTNIVMAAVQRALGEKDYADFPWKALFEPMGMKSVVWEKDAKGVFVGSSYLYATPRDMVKLGQLFLTDGEWEGKRLLPAGWVSDSLRPSPALKNPGDHKSSAGSSWWLNRPVPEGGVPAPWPKAPEDTFAALGHWGQTIFVVPSLSLIAVRVGDDRDESFDLAKYTELLVEVTR
jgi:CubicO group peptidase (beta-lactamase class C family)